LARYGDNIDNKRAAEKFLHVVPKKYSQVTIAIKMLSDFSNLSIEEVMGLLKAVDNREQLPPSEPDTIGDKLLFTKEQWLAASNRERGGFGFDEQPQAPAVQAGQGSPGTWWRS
jgi:hypothetical protein